MEEYHEIELIGDACYRMIPGDVFEELKNGDDWTLLVDTNLEKDKTGLGPVTLTRNMEEYFEKIYFGQNFITYSVYKENELIAGTIYYVVPGGNMFKGKCLNKNNIGSNYIVPCELKFVDDFLNRILSMKNSLLFR